MNNEMIPDEGSFEIDFRGQRFLVSPRPGDKYTLDFRWINGPALKVPTWLDDDYGFTSTGSSSEYSLSDLEKSISSFLVGFYIDVVDFYGHFVEYYAIPDADDGAVDE